jgi:conjugative transfer signal peptidase TraF
MSTDNLDRPRTSGTESSHQRYRHSVVQRQGFVQAKTHGPSIRSFIVVGSRCGLLIVALVGILVCTGVPWIHPPVQLVYNVSPSVPLGWYLRVPTHRLAVGMFVIAHLPPAAARLAARRGYLPLTVPVVKRIAAVPGELVCERSRVLSIDGRPVARALREDAQHRPLPVWSGCVTLAPGEYLLLGLAPDSYDSRYFGPVAGRAILGRAIPLWTWP